MIPAVELLKQACAENRALFGAYVRVPTAVAIENCALLGLHWVLLDTEQQSLTPENCRRLVCAAQHYGMRCFVQVTCVQRAPIEQFLDAGVCGIVLSKVTSALEVQQFVSMIEDASHKLPARDVLTGALIEFLDDIDSLEQIVATPGLNCVGVGPGAFTPIPAIVQAGKPQLAVVDSVEQTRTADKNGARLIAVSDDALLRIRGSALLQMY